MRQGYYQRIEQSLDLSHRIGRESDDGLLLAGWLLERWPARLYEAIAELEVAALRWQIGRWTLFGPEVECRLRHLLDPTLADAKATAD